MKRRIVTISVLLLLVLASQSPAPAPPPPAFFTFEELLDRADAVLILEVVKTGEIRRESDRWLYWIVRQTEFKVLARLKGEYPEQRWVLTHKSLDWSKYPGGFGNAPHDVDFSDKFHDAYVAFLCRKDARLEPVTGDDNIAPSFRMIKNLRPTDVDVRPGPGDSLNIGGTNVPVCGVAAYLETIGTGRDGHGISVVMDPGNPQNTNAWRVLMDFRTAHQGSWTLRRQSVSEGNVRTEPQPSTAPLPPAPRTGPSEGAH